MPVTRHAFHVRMLRRESWWGGCVGLSDAQAVMADGECGQSLSMTCGGISDVFLVVICIVYGSGPLVGYTLTLVAHKCTAFLLHDTIHDISAS